MRGGHAFFIDFQGMRPGLAEYDLASLLFDPYVRLSPAEREAVLATWRRDTHSAVRDGLLAALAG